tara:strand:+ start:3190 stop:4020 length:831 start_codon:yes stop_codon:yes gene_type:complete
MKQNRPLSYSALKAFSKSPKHLIAYWNKVFTPTPAMALGSLIHVMILEPQEFENRYFALDDEEICLDLIAEGAKSPRANGKYKAWKLEEMKKAEGKEIVNIEDVKLAKKIAKSVIEHPLVKALTFKEELIEWTFNGQPFKGFVDGAGALLPEAFRDQEGQGYILDVKTTKDAEPEAFKRDFVKYGYHNQGAAYKNANEELKFAGINPKYYVIAVETAEPFINQVYEIPQEFIDKGLVKSIKLIEDFKAWDGTPAGYEFGNELAKNGVLTLYPPAWL